MRTTQRKKDGIRCFLSIAIYLVMVLLAGSVTAGCPGQQGVDTDGDGFYDTEECAGLSTNTGGAKIDYPSCYNLNNDLTRNECLDPDSKDIFVELVPDESSSLMPDNPFAYFSIPVEKGGLGLWVHQLALGRIGIDRMIIMRPDLTFQKAIRIRESLLPASDTDYILGYANWGTPNDIDGATFYTKRIVDWVTSKCPPNTTTTCLDQNTGFTEENLLNHYMRYILAHESSHVMKLTLDYNSRFGGHHFKSGTGAVMDQSVVYTDRKGVVTFYIPGQYSELSRIDVNLAN